MELPKEKRKLKKQESENQLNNLKNKIRKRKIEQISLKRTHKSCNGNGNKRK